MLSDYTDLKDTFPRWDILTVCAISFLEQPVLAVVLMNYHAFKQFLGAVQGLGWVRAL